MIRLYGIFNLIRKRNRHRRDEGTGAAFQLNSNITESPIHDVTSGGGIEITVINDPDGKILLSCLSKIKSFVIHVVINVH